MSSIPTKPAHCVLLFLLAMALSGCSRQPAEYRPNLLFVASQSEDDSPSVVNRYGETAAELVAELLGDADSPSWPTDLPMVLDLDKAVRSAGPVGRNADKIERGLFRKHCVQCHGISGDGTGPAANLLAPYPRDFRRGTFKFKSTPVGKKPSHNDIVRTLEAGIPGTSMPAFETLKQSKEFAEDVDALAHYVRFLSIRGETERRLIVELIADETDQLNDATRSKARASLNRVVKDWSDADTVPKTTPPSNSTAPEGEELAAAISRGKELFLSELTACSKCHGELADGNGKSQDFDEWTKDWTIRAGIDPTKKSEWKPMKQFGALKPVIDRSRNLLLGSFRGGSNYDDLYRRLVLGIEGSPMPAVARKVNDNPGLSEDQIRDLILYDVSLSDSVKAPRTPATRSIAGEVSFESAH
jgi:mono/diheme cytochrome c family protein